MKSNTLLVTHAVCCSKLKDIFGCQRKAVATAASLSTPLLHRKIWASFSDQRTLFIHGECVSFFQCGSTLCIKLSARKPFSKNFFRALSFNRFTLCHEKGTPNERFYLWEIYAHLLLDILVGSFHYYWNWHFISLQKF